jgi:hypothetical protein
MSKAPLRIGIWFNSSHIAYGGPSLVLMGTLLGLYMQEEPPIVVLNEPGDINWFVDRTESFADDLRKVPNASIGPMVFSNGDAETEDYTKHDLWKHGRHFLVPSHWYRWWIQRGLPFDDKEKAAGRTCNIWGSGVDTDFFRPIGFKKQDFFIYFKSQNYQHLQQVHRFLFHNYFHYRGSVLVYYHYDKEMLREYANASRFCIMLDGTETQGLASLEIMACDCPLFVLDCTRHSGSHMTMDGASSVPCMDLRCGVKSSLEKMENDFPLFLKALITLRPREYVCESYSFQAAAKKLLDLLKNKSIVNEP